MTTIEERLAEIKRLQAKREEIVGSSMEKQTPASLTEELRTKLEPQMFDALARAVKMQEQRAEAAGYARSMREHAGYFGAMATARGLAKSWTAWVGAALLALPEVLPTIQADLPALLGPHSADVVMRVCGVLMILMRFKTTASLTEKGKC